MSKIKNMPGVAWLIIGVLVTLLVVPTTAYAAAALKFTGIEGTSTNKADVSPAGQLLTSPADPNSLYASTPTIVSALSGVKVAQPPSGSALVLTSLAVDVYYNPSGGGTNLIYFVVQNGSCSGDEVGSFAPDVAISGLNLVNVPIGSGVAIPAGDVLCGYSQGPASPEADVWANGYTVPSSSVAAGAVHALGSPPYQR